MIDELKRLAKKGGLSRRDFIERAIAAGIAVSLTEGIFSAQSWWFA